MNVETKVKERPILFSGEMVRAILDGRKTQTRRVVKNAHIITTDDRTGATDTPCPFGAPGDRLWVKETFSPCACTGCREAWPAQPAHRVLYRATHAGHSGIVWKPSIHMPRWASRLTLEIVSVKVERLQDISEKDAIAEGIEQDGHTPDDNSQCWKLYDGGVMRTVHVRESFASLWESINGLGSWALNPWVWVIEFKRMEQSA